VSSPVTLRRVGRQAAVYGVGDLLVKSLSFLLIPILTRAWSAASPEMGLYEMLHLAEAVSYILFNMGLATAVIKVLADYRHGRARGSVLFTALGLLCTVSFGLFLALWAAAPTLAPMLFGPATTVYDHTLLLRLTLLATYLSTFRFVAFSVLRVEGCTWRYTALNLLNFLVYVGVAIYLVVLEGQGVRGIVLANVTASVVMLAVVSGLLLSRARRPFSGRRARALYAFGLPLLPNGMALWALALIDRLLLRELLPATAGDPLAAVGQYGVAYRFGMIVAFLLVVPLRTAWVPALFTVRDDPDAPRIYGRLLTWVVALGGALALGLATLSHEIITVVAQPDYLAAAGPLPVIAFAYVAYGASQVLDAGILASGRTTLYPVITLTSVVVNVGLCLLLIPDHGMMGAAWATLAAYVWHALLLGLASHRIAPFRVEWGRLLLVAITAAAVGALALQVPQWTLWLRVAAKVGILGLYPIILMLAGFVTPAEVRTLTGSGARRGAETEVEEGELEGAETEETKTGEDGA